MGTAETIVKTESRRWPLSRVACCESQVACWWSCWSCWALSARPAVLVADREVSFLGGCALWMGCPWAVCGLSTGCLAGMCVWEVYGKCRGVGCLQTRVHIRWSPVRRARPKEMEVRGLKVNLREEWSGVTACRGWRVGGGVNVGRRKDGQGGGV